MYRRRQHADHQAGGHSRKAAGAPDHRGGQGHMAGFAGAVLPGREVRVPRQRGAHAGEHRKAVRRGVSLSGGGERHLSRRTGGGHRPERYPDRRHAHPDGGGDRRGRLYLRRRHRPVPGGAAGAVQGSVRRVPGGGADQRRYRSGAGGIRPRQSPRGAP